MSPDFFIIPIIMGQASSIIEALKTGIIFVDMAFLGLFIFLFYNTDKDYVKDIYRRWIEHNKKSIVISTEVNNRTVKFNAIMFYLTQKNETVYRLKEDAEIDWETDKEKRSGYLVEQRKEFKLTEDIRGHIVSGMKEKHRNAQHTELVDFNTLVVYTYTLSLDALQAWVDEKVAAYKEHLRHTTNDKQLFITARAAKTNETGGKKKKSSICIESVNWESAITFANSYFQEMDTVLKKIDFFLNNKAWYQAKGIPYNLGILLYGEPGCGKTRFIKQLMNHTKRHGIDIKLNDGMDFHDLQHLIYNEELDETHIIPQDQRVLIFEDIDALGEVVKERSASVGEKASHNVCDTSNNDIKIISSILKMTNENKNNNLSYLLNMLDGIHECSGRILIMTTNKVDVLDKALIRPGRIDIKLHFKKCSAYDVSKMIEKFWDIQVAEADILPELVNKYTSADIINIFRSTDDFTTIQQEFLHVKQN
jgi:ATP-dependent 26S proteasome regulatory subunit